MINTRTATASLTVNLVQQTRLVVATRGRGSYDLTPQLHDFVSASGMQVGMLHVFCHHTSCSLLITENADPDVHGDIERFLARLVPDGDSLFRHDSEGPDDMPAHIRAILTSSSLQVPVCEGRLGLGTWQGIYLWEHRFRPHARTVTATLMGHAPGRGQLSHQ